MPTSRRLDESGTSDYFELSGVASGDLADVLGLQTGDIPLSVNSYSLDGMENAIAAYSAVENDSTLVLTFSRSSSIYTHTYYSAYTQWRRRDADGHLGTGHAPAYQGPPSRGTLNRMRSRRLVTLSIVGSLAACEGDPLPITYETEHLRIGTDLEHPLCAGDLVAYEQIISRVEDELGLTMKSTFTVSIWSDEAWQAVRKEYCGSDPRTLGCTSYRDNAIYTSWSAVEHEVVHAATPITNLTPFFAEGLADVYSGAQTRFGLTAPADSLDLSSEDVARGTARHFVMWLRETWGDAKLGELAKLGKSAGSRFEDVYGLSFAEAQEMYFANAPWGYPGIYTCGGAPLEFVDEFGGWQSEIAFDCDNGQDVRAYGIGLSIQRTFVIPVAGHYSVSTDAGAILLSRCATGPIEEPLRDGVFRDDDVPPSYAGYPSEDAVFHEGGSIVDLYFEAGKHQITVLIMGYEPDEVNLSIWPTLGPRPVEGQGN